jgi:hypothetical protein
MPEHAERQDVYAAVALETAPPAPARRRPACRRTPGWRRPCPSGGEPEVERLDPTVGTHDDVPAEDFAVHCR